VHPAAPDLLVDLSVSERGLPGEGDEDARAQAGSFLDSLRFISITPSATLSTPRTCSGVERPTRPRGC
jgi:hypothetical protein